MSLPTIYVRNTAELQTALAIDPTASRIHIVTPEEEIQAAYAAAFEEGRQEAINEAVLEERRRYKLISQIAPKGCEKEVAEALQSGESPEQFAYRLTLAAMAGGPKFDPPNSSSTH
jgi:hypothetical protein